MSISCDGVDDYAQATFAPFTAAAGTLFCRHKLAALGTARMLVELSNGVATTNAFRLATDASNHILAQTIDSGGTSTSTTAGTIADTTAFHSAIAIFGAANSRIAGLDGTFATAQTTSRTPTGITTMRIGLNIVNNQDYSGVISHIAGWTVALSAQDFTDLHAGASPYIIQRANLTCYIPTLDANGVGIDVVSGNTFTLGGNAAYNSDNPAVAIYRRRSLLVGVG
jgi:hypothetical protein